MIVPIMATSLTTVPGSPPPPGSPTTTVPGPGVSPTVPPPPGSPTPTTAPPVSPTTTLPKPPAAVPYLVVVWLDGPAQLVITVTNPTAHPTNPLSLNIELAGARINGHPSGCGLLTTL